MHTSLAFPVKCFFMAATCGIFAGAAQSQEVLYGDFIYAENIDDFDDTNTSFIYTESSNQDRNAMLAWRCFSDGLNIVYFFDKYLAGDDDEDVVVRYRIDRQEPSDRLYWQLLVVQKSAYMRMNMVDSFTELAIAGSEVRLEVTDPLDGERMVDNFSLKGLQDGLNDLHCYEK